MHYEHKGGKMTKHQQSAKIISYNGDACMYRCSLYYKICTAWFMDATTSRLDLGRRRGRR